MSSSITALRTLPLLVLLPGLVLSAWILLAGLRERTEQDRADFVRMTQNMESAIEQRFQLFHDAVQAGAAFVGAQGHIDQASWQEFVERFELQRRYPDVRVVSVVNAVRDSELADFLARRRAEGPSDWQMRRVLGGTSNPSGEHFIVLYLSPVRGNEAAYGIDLASEVTRRAAAEEARATGGARLAAPLSLVQAGKERPAALLFYPVYRRGADLSTVEGRREAFVCWTNVGFHFDDVIGAVLQQRQGKAHVRVFHGATDKGALVFSTYGEKTPRRLERVGRISFGGHEFTAHWTRGNEFTLSSRWPAILAALGTLALTLIVALYVRLLQQGSQRAEKLVAERTTELRATAEALQVSEQRWSFALESSAQGVWDWRADRAEIFFSTKWKELFGYENVSNLDLSNWQPRVHPEDWKFVEEDLQRHLRAETAVFDREYRMRRGDGRYIWVHDRSRVLERDAEGQPLRMIGTHTDITARKEAEMAVRESEERLTRIYHAVAAGFVMHDRSGAIVECNRAAESILGLTREQLLGRKSIDPRWRSVRPDGTPFPGEDHPAMLALREGRSVRDAEMGVDLPEGGRRWLSVNAEPLRDANGAINGSIASFADITERRQFLQEIQAARDAALESSRLKSEFMANMSHEIRTPMNGILGTTELLLSMKLTDDQRELTQVAHSSAEALMGIVNDILDFAKIEAGRVDIGAAAFEVRTLGEEVATLFRSRAAAKGLQLVTRFDAGVPAQWVGDALRVRQVLSNLVSNAVKFTDQGSVTISVSASDVGGVRHLRVEVKDTGIGISEATQARLFQAFVQGDGSATRRHGGTGLGLAICRQLVQLMGGRIGLETEVGRGSTFWFELPPRDVAPSARRG